MMRTRLLILGGVVLFSSAALLQLTAREDVTSATLPSTAVAPSTTAPATSAAPMPAATAASATVRAAPEPTLAPPVRPEVRQQALAALLEAADKQERRLQAQLGAAKQRGANGTEISTLEQKLARVDQARDYAIVKHAQLGN